MKEQGTKFKDDCQLREMAEMLASYWLKKEDICKMFNIENTRTAREKISIIANELPVISSSKREGYKVATETDNIELLKRADRELESRIKALQKRRKPLKKEIAKRSAASEK